MNRNEQSNCVSLIKATEVLHKISEIFVTKGVPDHMRSDNGSEFRSNAARSCLDRLGVNTLFMETGSSWENIYIESSVGKLRNELLHREIFDNILETNGITENWRKIAIIKYHELLVDASINAILSEQLLRFS